MATKLSWVYQDRAVTPEYRTEYKGLVLRAVHDHSPSNPFTDGDCNWPIIVRSPDDLRGATAYRFGDETSFAPDVRMFGDEALVHNQHHIARLLGSTVGELIENHTPREDTTLVKHCWDADVLRYAFNEDIADRYVSDVLGIIEALCKMAGLPAYLTTVRGYSQSDWAEVLVVATEEARARFGVSDVRPEDLKRTADLYAAWAFGDVYGYSIGRPVLDEDGDEIDFDELDSCWGYYGTDFDESGLEEAAMSAADQHAKEVV